MTFFCFCCCYFVSMSNEVEITNEKKKNLQKCKFILKSNNSNKNRYTEKKTKKLFSKEKVPIYLLFYNNFLTKRKEEKNVENFTQKIQTHTHTHKHHKRKQLTHFQFLMIENHLLLRRCVFLSIVLIHLSNVF